MKMISRFAVPVIVLVLVGLSVALAVSLKNSQREDVSKKIGLTQHLGDKLPLDTKFKDEHGKTIQLGSLFGKKPVLMMLVFYRCRGTCQLEIENATKVFSELKTENIGRDFDVVSVSIHPRETPELAAEKKADTLRSYNRPGAYDGWHFLTGSEDQIRKLSDAIGYKYSYNPKTDQIIHPTGLFVCTPDGRLSRYLYGFEYATSLVADSLTTASQGKINVPSEPILFGCVQVDPKTGRTTLNVFRALQVGGISTVLILAASIFFMSRKPYRYSNSKEDELRSRP